MTLVSTMPSVQTQSEPQNNANPDSLSVKMNAEYRPDLESHASTRNQGANQDVPLQQLFEETFNEKGEHSIGNLRWVGENEVEVNGLSNMTLHNFILKAEALGKKVTYRRNIVLTITD